MANQKKGQKVGRNLKSGQNMAYKAEKRHEKSHVLRIKKHIARYGGSKDANEALMRYAERAGVARSASEFLKAAKR